MTVNKEVKCGLSKSPKGSLKKNIAKLCIREVAVTKKRIILRSAVLKFPGKVRNGMRPAIAMNANRLRSDSRWWSISLIKCSNAKSMTGMRSIQRTILGILLVLIKDVRQYKRKQISTRARNGL